MTQVGQQIENPVTGQTIIFRATGRETNGEMFQAEGIFRPGGFAGVLHLHPFQEERFEVMQGTCGFQIGRKQVQLGPGETIVVPAGQPHTFWNAGPDEMRVIFKFRPALPSTERFYEFYFGLARAGKAGKDGLPSIWQMALQVDEFADHVRLARPPWWLQRLIFTLLRPLARLLGYQRLDYTMSM
jgi:mannose-6-phosphate isomerase-like protein (cupin superfamily)